MNPYIYVLSINGLLFFFSLVFYFFPPKKINNFYGYRTKKSMLNDDIWSFANQQFNKSFIRYSFLGFLAALVLETIGSGKVTWQPMVILLFTLGATILKTEQSISQNFDEEGKQKKN
jgi:uncharacterized membrane protein